MAGNFKFDISLDADGKPSGVANVVPASLVDGLVHGITGVMDSTKGITGTPALVSKAVLPTVAALGTSKFVSGSFIPRRAGA